MRQSARNWVFKGAGYVPVTDDVEPSQYRRIGVHQLTIDEWAVDGGCV